MSFKQVRCDCDYPPPPSQVRVFVPAISLRPLVFPAASSETLVFPPSRSRPTVGRPHSAPDLHVASVHARVRGGGRSVAPGHLAVWVGGLTSREAGNQYFCVKSFYFLILVPVSQKACGGWTDCVCELTAASGGPFVTARLTCSSERSPLLRPPTAAPGGATWRAWAARL